MADAARRMAKARLDELGSAAGKMLLGAMRAKLGSDVADAIEEFAHDLSTSVDERLAARISAAGDGDVIEIIAGFAAEAAALVRMTVTCCWLWTRPNGWTRTMSGAWPICLPCSRTA